MTRQTHFVSVSSVLFGLLFTTLCIAAAYAEIDTLVPAGSVWKYLDNGSNQGTAWIDSFFDDSGWASGPAQLGYGDGDEATVVSYGGNSSNKYITTYFRAGFTVADPSLYESLSLRVLRDDAAVVYLNGLEVHRANITSGTVTYSTAASSAIEDTWDTVVLDPSALTAGTNVFAVEIHQSSGTSSDISFDLALEATLIPPPPSPPANVTVLGPTVPTSPTLQLKVSTPDELPGSITFYGRRKPAPEESFTIVVLPDTQYYTQNYPGIFTAQTQWIVNNIETRNIIFVTHEGDLVQNADSSTTEWTNADTAMSLLDGFVAYGMCLGNHDFNYDSDVAALFNQTFPYTRYEGLPWYGGHYPAASNQNNYQLVSACGVDLVIVHLEFWPDTDDIAWADSVLKAHSDRLAIITTHGFLDESGNRNVHVMGSTEYIWNNLVVPNENVYFVLCGHVHSEYARTDETNGRQVHQLLADYQEDSNGGNGWLRIMKFVPADARVYVQTYSPYLGSYQTDSDSQFDLDCPMVWYHGIDTQTNIPSGSTVATVWNNLEPETNYEWFVQVTDSQNNISSGPLWTFTTKSQDAPIAEDDTYAVDEDGLLVIEAPGVLENDTDSGGNPLTNATLVADCSHGQLTLNADGSFTYQPDADFCGTDTFTYSSETAENVTDTAVVTVTVNGINDAPIALDNSVVADEDTDLAIVLSGADGDGDNLTYETVTLPANGTLSGTAPDLIYTPQTDYIGPDSFSFKVSDGTLESNIASIAITVNSINDAPVATDDAASTNEEEAVVIDLLINDSDIEGDTLAIQSFTQPARGNVINNGHGTVIYTPNANENGSDTFEYTVMDGNGGQDAATVSVTIQPVNDAPVAGDDSAATQEDMAVTISVLANDSDVDGDALNIQSVTNGTHGTVVNNGTSVTYTPDAGFIGDDTFAYTVTDGNEGTDTASVTVTVVEFNHVPIANDDEAITDEDIALVIDVLANDTDADNDLLTAVIVSGPTNGILSPNPDRSFSYTPNSNFHGSDSFAYKANDGTADSATATVTITVNPINDAPVANAQTVNVNEDGSVAITLTGSDVEGASLTYSIDAGPSSGSLSGLAPTLTYTPNAEYYGSDSFTFRVNDGQLDSSVATVSITITAINDPPTANNLNVTTDEDNPVAIILSGDDMDGDPLSYGIVTGPQNGSLSGVSPNLTYTPYTNYNGSDSFTFIVNDGQADSAIAQVDLTIQPVNDAPVANDDAYSTNQDTELAIAAPGVLGNDSDVDGDVLTAAVLTGPVNGSLTLNADGSFTYTPDAGFAGTDSFTYTVSDGNGGTASATASITVQAASANSVTVAQIEMRSKVAGRNYFAQAVITVHDQNSNPMAGAVVYGEWYFNGDSLGSAVSSGTAGDGKVTLDAPKQNTGGIFTFKVTDVVLAGYNYTPGVTENSVTVP